MDDHERNLQAIQSIYAAFGRGDVPGILERCSSDVAFAFEGASPSVAWHGPWHGASRVGQFFATIAEAVEFQAFEPQSWLASNSDVAVLVRMRYRVRATGKQVDQRQVHWWSLQSGKVTQLCHHEDTAQVIEAVRSDS